MKRGVAALCALIALVAGLAPGSASGVAHPDLGEIDAAPFTNACGIAVNSEGDVYVADYYENRIRIFSKKGAELTEIANAVPSVPGVNLLTGPCDLAVDSAGRLYVNDWHRDVVRFTPSSPPPVTKATTFGSRVVVDTDRPTSVAVDPETDNLLVSNRTHISAYEPSLAPVLAGGEPLRIGLGSIGDGYGIAVSHYQDSEEDHPEGLIYVADVADQTIKAFDPSASPTAPVATIDGAGTPRGTFYLADSDLAVDPEDGHLYVTDNLQPDFEHPELTVDEFSASGHYRGRLPSIAEGAITRMVDGIPSSLAIGPDRKIYVTSGNYELSVVRVFGPAPSVPTRILSVQRTGAGRVASNPAGIGCGVACAGEFDRESQVVLGQPTLVVLTATPAPHNRFVGWTGCDSSAAPNTCTVAMSNDRTVSAEFEPIPQLSLTVTGSGAGFGTVASAPAGIDCGDACAAEFDAGSTVTLSATPAPGSRVGGWSGCDSEPVPRQCEVSMTAIRSVGVEFEPIPPPSPPDPSPPSQRVLAIALTGEGGASGTVTSEPAGISCGTACAYPYPQGTAVILVAHPLPGSRFVGWGGCDAAAGGRCVVPLESDTTVVAAFGPGRAGVLRVHDVDVEGATAAFTIGVPTAGILSAVGRGLRSATALPLAPGQATMRVHLNSSGLRMLQRARDHRLAVKTVLTLTPFDGGERTFTARAVVFGGSRARSAEPMSSSAPFANSLTDTRTFR